MSMRADGQVIGFIKEGILCIASKSLSDASARRIDGTIWKQDSAAPEKPTEPDKETWWQHWWNRIKKWLS
jgi:hypothetical protein